MALPTSFLVPGIGDGANRCFFYYLEDVIVYRALESARYAVTVWPRVV